MKINWNKKYNTYAAYACIVGAALIFLVFLGIYFRGVVAFFGRILDVLAPILYGAGIAYILSPLCKFFEKKLFAKMRGRRVKRALSMVLSYAIVSAVIALLVYAMLPNIVRSFNDLQNNLIVYANSLQSWGNSISESSPYIGALIKPLLDYIDVASISESLTHLFESLSNILAELAPVVLSFANSFMVQVKNILLGLIFSAYFLASKELVAAQVRKLLHAIISDEKYNKISYFIRFSDHTFGRYLLGTLVDSVLVACEFLVVLNIFDFPYAPLVSVVCGFTNMIPIFGPFIGAIPSFFIIFISNPIKAFWFILVVLAIQQIDGNIIAPRIIGESTGLSAIAVISAVTIMGGFFGLLGMIIGVPLCAVFANIINNKTDARIAEKEKRIRNKLAYAEPAEGTGGLDKAEVLEPGDPDAELDLTDDDVSSDSAPVNSEILDNGSDMDEQFALEPDIAPMAEEDSVSEAQISGNDEPAEASAPKVAPAPKKRRASRKKGGR